MIETLIALEGNIYMIIFSLNDINDDIQYIIDIKDRILEDLFPTNCS